MIVRKNGLLAFHRVFGAIDGHRVVHSRYSPISPGAGSGRPSPPPPIPFPCLEQLPGLIHQRGLAIGVLDERANRPASPLRVCMGASFLRQPKQRVACEVPRWVPLQLRSQVLETIVPDSLSISSFRLSNKLVGLYIDVIPCARPMYRESCAGIACSRHP